MADLANYNTYIQQISSIGTQATAGSSSNYYVQHFGEILNGSMQIAADGNSAATQNGIQRIVKAIVSFIGKASAAADKDIDDSDKRIKDGKKEVEDKRTENEKKIDELLEEIKTNTDAIEKIIEELEKLGNEDFKAIQDELKETQEEIQENIEKLKEDPDDEEALAKIEELSGYIKDTLLPSADALLEAINTKTADVATNQAQIEVKSSEANEIIAANLNEIKALENETAKEAITNSKFTITGESEIALGTELQASAAATEIVSIGTGTAAAAEMQQKALDYIKAGTTHISGSATNLTNLGTAIGAIGGNFTAVSGCMNKVGSALNDAVKLVGDYEAARTPLITSIGTWKEQTSAKQEELQVAINEYQGVDADGNCKYEDENNKNDNNLKRNPEKLLNFKFNTEDVA